MSRFPRPTHRLVLIEWVDSHGGGSWLAFDDMRSEPMPCLSVGWLVKEDRYALMVVPHLNSEDEQGTGEMVIPRVAVNRIVRLREGRAA